MWSALLSLVLLVLLLLSLVHCCHWCYCCGADIATGIATGIVGTGTAALVVGTDVIVQCGVVGAGIIVIAAGDCWCCHPCQVINNGLSNYLIPFSKYPIPTQLRKLLGQP